MKKDKKVSTSHQKNTFDVKWQMKKFNLSEKDAIEKIKSIREKRKNKRPQTKNWQKDRKTFDVKWQMERFNLSEEDAIEKIKNIKEKYSNSFFNSYSIKAQMEKFDLSEEEAIEKIHLLKNKTLEKFNSYSDFDFKAMSPKNKEHWIKKGFTEEEAIKLGRDQVKYMQNCFSEKRIGDPEKYKDTYITKKEYWIKRGLTEEESILKISENQKTFSLDICIKKYGEEQGRIRWQKRQDQWLKTLDSKSTEEKIKIKQSKLVTLDIMIKKYGEEKGRIKFEKYEKRCHCFSKISMELFRKILKNITDKENVQFATHNGEKYLKTETSYYLYDFCYKNKIIEFNGDIWHANPNIYESDSTPHPYSSNTSENIWKKDLIKKEFAEKNGFQVFVVWEQDYRKNKEEILKQCIKFLKN